MWPNPQCPADLATLAEEILNGKLHFLCSVCNKHILAEPDKAKKIEDYTRLKNTSNSILFNFLFKTTAKALKYKLLEKLFQLQATFLCF